MVLDLYSAMLGREIFVNTFDGKVKLKIRPEKLANTQIKLKGKGFPRYKKGEHFGDLYITYSIKNQLISRKKKRYFLRNLLH